MHWMTKKNRKTYLDLKFRINKYNIVQHSNVIQNLYAKIFLSASGIRNILYKLVFNALVTINKTEMMNKFLYDLSFAAVCIFLIIDSKIIISVLDSLPDITFRVTIQAQDIFYKK